jgi:hypothetical protein
VRWRRVGDDIGGRRRRRGEVDRAVARRYGDVLEVGNTLAAPVLQDLEIPGREVRDGPVVRVGDDDVELDVVDATPEDWRPSLGSQRETHQAGDAHPEQNRQ